LQAEAGQRPVIELLERPLAAARPSDRGGEAVGVGVPAVAGKLAVVHRQGNRSGATDEGRRTVVVAEEAAHHPRHLQPR
jgi:hypothetical protein